MISIQNILCFTYLTLVICKIKITIFFLILKWLRVERVTFNDTSNILKKRLTQVNLIQQISEMQHNQFQINQPQITDKKNTIKFFITAIKA